MPSAVRLTSELDKWFNKVRARRVADLKGKDKTDQLRQVRRKQITRAEKAELKKILTASRNRRIKRVAAQTARKFGGRFKPDDKFIAGFFEPRDAHMDTFLRDAEADLKRVIRDEVKAGKAPSTLGRRIRGRQPGTALSRARATRIARTEIVGQENLAIRAGAEAAGAKRFRWLTSRDERFRSAHRAAHKQTVKAGQPFRVGGELLLFPGDPNGSPGNVIACRCRVRPLKR